MKTYKKLTFRLNFRSSIKKSYKLFDTKHDQTTGCDFGDHLGLHSDKVLEGYVSRRNMHRSIAYIYILRYPAHFWSYWKTITKVG